MDNRNTERKRNSARRFREEDMTVLNPVGIVIAVVTALVVVGVVLLFATGILRVPTAPAEKPVSSAASEETVSSEAPVSSAPEVVSLVNDPNVPYQSMHPELAHRQPVFAQHPEGDKTVYLTFNDTPGDGTDALLQLLQEKGVQATFFVSAAGLTDAEFQAAVGKIAAGGHALGVVGYSSDTDSTFAGVDSYLDDFKLCDDLVLAAIGQRAVLCRFPGGSGNNYFTGSMGEAVADEMLRRGYVYHDWNVDATGSASAAEVVAACGVYDKNVVLLSDDGDVAYIGGVIDALKAAGYRIAVLDETVKPFRFY